MDGNATFNLIQCAYDQDRVYKELSAKIEDLKQVVDNNTASYQDFVAELDNKYASDIQEVKNGL